MNNENPDGPPDADELFHATRRPGYSPVVSSMTEFFVGGRRFAPGTYKIIRLGITPTDDNQF